ncbi:Uncharacterised protein [Mycobacteroides abscessus subsp. abscessus]|nr:Uncharacterised protein [Mycobacteroides abscessus subsp. abscessus]
MARNHTRYGGMKVPKRLLTCAQDQLHDSPAENGPCGGHGLCWG